MGWDAHIISLLPAGGLSLPLSCDGSGYYGFGYPVMGVAKRPKWKALKAELIKQKETTYIKVK